MKLLICSILIFQISFASCDENQKPVPWCWSNGEPIWKEGESLPPDGKGFVVICARKGGLVDKRESKFIRPAGSWFGHVWIEFLDGHGMSSSESINKPNILATEDIKNFAFDKDTFRFAFLVPNDTISQIQEAIKMDVAMGYHFLFNSCVTVSGHCAEIADVLAFLSPNNPNLFKTTEVEKGAFLGVVPIIKPATPSRVYSTLKMKTEDLIGLVLSSKESRQPLIYVPVTDGSTLFDSSFGLKLEANLDMLPRRGNFGGIVLSKMATLCLNMEEIRGAIFDEATSQLILVGTKPIYLPPMRFDDLAVAMQSIYGLKGNPPQDPAVSLEHGNEGEMIVKYYGEIFGTGFGKTLFEGDYALKMLLLGKYTCHVPGFKSFPERYWLHAQRIFPACNCRTWIMPDKIVLVQSPDSSSMVFSEVKMKCSAVTTCQGDEAHSLAHDECAEFITNHYEAISSEYPVFSELKRLGQITGLVKWLRENQIPFDPSFFASYKPILTDTPKTIPSFTVDSFQEVDSISLTGGVIYHFGPDNYSLNNDSSADLFKQQIIDSRPVGLPLSWDCGDLRAQAFPFAKTRKEGNLLAASIDIAGPISLIRFYDSFNDADVGLGRGWSVIPYNIESPLNAPYLLLREGSHHWIYEYINGVYLREDRSQILHRTGRGDIWALQLEGGDQCLFNSDGRLVQFINKNKVVTEYLYEKDRLAVIQQGQNWVRLQYSSDRMSRVESSSGIQLTYLFDGKLLGGLSDGNGDIKIVYKYDEDSRLTGMIGQDGQTLFRGSYDDYNRLISERWSLVSKE